MNRRSGIQTIVAIGIGAAVFMILGRFGAIPTGIPNTSIETAYAFLALMAVLYGPVAGFSIGFIGHTLKDLTTYVKLKKLIRECIGTADIEVKEYEYSKLSLMGKEDKIFSDYDVRLIISTTKIDIDGAECLLLQDLMSGDSDDIFVNALKEITLDKNIDMIRQDLVKMFSMENLVSRMTILNPGKIINEVEDIIINYERILGTIFCSELKMTLYIHVSILIERLMIKQGLEFEIGERDYEEKNNKFIDITNRIFSPLLREYNLSITTKEISIIQTIIESRIGKIEL